MAEIAGFGADDVLHDLVHGRVVDHPLGHALSAAQHHDSVGHSEYVLQAMADKDHGNAARAQLGDEIEYLADLLDREAHP